MKKFNLIIFSIFLTIGLNAQWARTNVSINNNVTIEDMCVHNNELYAAVFDSGLVKLNTTTQQWETVQNSLPPSSNSAHITHLASSGNSLYAYVNNQTCASTTIYKSTDNGVTFVTDSAGHPLYGSFPAQCAGQPFDVANVFVLNGKLINVINGGFYSKYPSDPAWVKTTDPNVTFGEQFSEYNNTWYVWSDNYKLHTSTDNGQTWTTPTNSGLPPMFYAKVMNVNPTSGRIYIAGNSLSTNAYKLLYSDNEGLSWDSLPINQYLGLDWIGQKQKLHGMISNGNNITAMLVNDANNSHPNVIKSTDGGQTFSVDTVGLQPNAFGTVLISRMLYFNGDLYLAPNYFDIYKQGTSSTSINEVSKINVQAYPNPVTHTVHIKNDNPITSISVTNMIGEILLSETPLYNTHSINFETFPSGIYFVTISATNQTQTLKVVKK